MLANRVIDWTAPWREEGIKEGIKEGIERGIQEGLEKGIQEGLEKGIQEGLEKGIQEGIKEGQMLLLLEQMEAKLGPPSAEHRALVLAASDAERHRLATRLLFAPSYAELFSPATPPSP